jgi:hypothetical protein
MKNRFNIDAPVSEMNFRELKFFMDYVYDLDQTVDTGYITD